MKKRKIIYTIVGSILILLNLLVDITEPGAFRASEDKGYSIGYFIGSHLLLIIGLILLRLAYKLNKRLKKMEIQEMINNIGKPG